LYGIKERNNHDLPLSDKSINLVYLVRDGNSFLNVETGKIFITKNDQEIVPINLFHYRELEVDKVEKKLIDRGSRPITQDCDILCIGMKADTINEELVKFQDRPDEFDSQGNLVKEGSHIQIGTPSEFAFVAAIRDDFKRNNFIAHGAESANILHPEKFRLGKYVCVESIINELGKPDVRIRVAYDQKGVLALYNEKRSQGYSVRANPDWQWYRRFNSEVQHG